MIKIIGVSGSPRVGGNTELLVKEALKTASEERVETEFISLAGLNLKPCQACRSCGTTKECIQKDDFQAIFSKMVEADGLILASPVYFGSATPQIMSLISRAGLVSGAKGRVLENKVGGPLAIARRAGHNFTFAQLMFFFFQQGMIIPGSTYWNIAFGREKGEVLNDEEGLRTIRNFAKKMVWLIKKIKE
ncbi:MAG: 2-amino-4-deoxychorismate dehydrogenase [candidate division WS2 bacterium]|nr:2-amino-4-deoxychorismate dehydrogenase [Candidatus Psychracetigena formicireducens]MBT9137561.1 2-amino-4-deoxychorismate dehydrogenase [Bacillota bacterium]MBT9150176.1 2-amino-4-deoxychorismate dehydrogenase [Candidatus Psychracetigena formicireducens]